MAGLPGVLNEVGDIPLVIALPLVFVLFLLVNKVADVVFDRWGDSRLGMLLFIGIGVLSTGLYLATKSALTPTTPVLVP